MDTQEIIDAVNDGLEVFQAGPFTATQPPERFHRTELHGELEGRSVRVEVSVDEETGPYQYSIWLFDKETGDPLGRGNGGATLSEAASIYQWNNALSDLRALQS